MKRLIPQKIIQIGQELFDTLDYCQICPMECRVNRHEGELGKCKSGSQVKVSSCNLHFGEEPPLSSGGGSGTIFLSNCPLFCKYCQNYPISQYGTGSECSIDELKDMMLELQGRGAENINFVTPDHMLPMILIALGKAKSNGLNIPIVYNCSGYENLEILRLLDGIIDIYLVDMRYNDDKNAKALSGCDSYVRTNRTAVKEMFRQVGNLEFDEQELAKTGVLVRHLVLPGGLSGSEGIFRYLAGEVSPDIYVSLMSQYFPAYKAVGDDSIGRQLTFEEFDRAVRAFYQAGLENGYIQEIRHESVL